MSDTEQQREWMQRVLGYAPRVKGSLPGGKSVSISSLPSGSLDDMIGLDESDDDSAPLLSSSSGKDKPKSKKSKKKSKKSGKNGYDMLEDGFIPEGITPSILNEKPKDYDLGGSRSLQVRTGKNGEIALTTPSPPIAEITFSGGGGKGAALPGAVFALQDTLKNVGVVKGASVGSMTAALVAAGIDPEEFKRVANDPETTARILEGRTGGKSALVHGLMGESHKLSGEGLHTVVREEMNDAVKKQITAYLKQSGQKPPSDKELDLVDLEDGGDDAPKSPGDTIKALLKKMKGNQAGVTFGDLRVLHGFIPAIKEVEISATMVGDDIGEEVSPEDMNGGGGKQSDDEDAPLLQENKPNPVEKTKPQLVMFTADTQPHVEVALACQASAALPPVFKPVEIELEGGFKGKFIDGGVLNNAPSSKTVRAKREVDPIPESSGMTFIFQEEKDAQAELFEGKATPEKPGSADKITEAPHASAEYGRKRTLADSPEDVVVVPLTFKTKGAFGRTKTEDFTGLLSGTVNFDISEKNKLKLQEMTEEETTAHLKKRKEPETRTYSSAKQMLNCISQSDLEGLAKQAFPGAAEELAFRTKVLDSVAALVKLQTSAQGKPDAQKEQEQLTALEKLADGDPDRLGFVGREIARSGSLDGLMGRQKEAGSKLNVVKAGDAVVSSLDTKANAQFILQDVVYPMLVTTGEKSPKRAALLNVDNLLRAALFPEDVNDALDLAIEAFSKGKASKEKTAFVDECKQHKMKV
jgi:exoenzyme U